MKRMILSIAALTIAAAAAMFSPVDAQKKYALREGNPRFRIPAEIKPFVVAGMKAGAYAKADLNGDGTLDYILVLEQSITVDSEMNTRPALIIVRDARGKLSVAARNRLAIFCRGCIGGTNDPFVGIEIGRRGFTITNRGGARDSWVGNYEFSYSRREKTWQLSRVVEANYEAGNPKPVWKKAFTPPKYFGKINFADFDPEDYLGKGERGEGQNKTRAVKIYLLEYPADDRTVQPKIVQVERFVDAETPLAGAMEAMLAAMIEKKEAAERNKYLHKLRFVSARIKNGTARLDFQYERDTEFDWLTERDSSFQEIVIKTATQFPTVKRVLMCINGYELRDDDEKFKATNCDEIWRKQ